MSYKKITHKTEMSEKILLGIREIAGITSRTLGPGGLPILLERQGVTPSGDPLPPQITKDGVTVAGECSSQDPEVDLVIQTVKAICSRTNRVAGDGTTTAIVLGESILSTTLDFLKEVPDANPQIIREAIEASSRRVIEKLKEFAIPCKDHKVIVDVAAISANGDREIGEIIGQAFEAVGSEGVITVDEGTSAHTTIEVVDGFQIRRGAEAQDRFFNNSEQTRFEAEDVKVILYDGKLASFTEILPLLNVIAKASAKALPPIVLVAHEFSPEVIQFLLIQRAEMGARFCAIKAPHTTNIRTQFLDDMSILLGAYRFGNGNRSLNNPEISLKDIGSCKRVVIDKYSSTFYDGLATDEQILARVEQLKALRKQAESPYDAAIISDRIAALSGGVAKIGVGGLTDLEIKERYHRIEDALNSARAAVEEGIIPGGGIVLAQIALELAESDDVGDQIMSRALVAPFNQIIENIAEDPDMVLSLPEWGSGDEPDAKLRTYDARNKKVVNALEAGIIDPVKVTRSALENATSIAALLSTCGGAITFPRKLASE